MRKAALALLIAAASLAWLGPAASAQSPEVVSTDFRRDNWPATVDVSALVRGAELSEATLLYRVLPEGAITRLPAEITAGDATRLRAEIPTARGGVWIPSGSRFEWQWQLITADGEEHLTELQPWAFEDPRYEWREVRRGGVIIHYYGAEELATVLAAEGAESLETSEALLETEVGFPIHVYVWLGSEDAQGVDRPRPEGYAEQIVTGGQRVLADLIHVFTPTRWVVRHEVTHVLTKVAGEGGIGAIPAWLDEGMATIRELDWQERRMPAVNNAIREDSVLTLRAMESSANVAGQIDLFYGQSAAIVDFLIEQYGGPRMAELFRVFKAGSTTENALQEVYGFGRDDLENQWRESVGLAPRERGEDRSTTVEDEVISGPVIADGDSEDDGGASQSTADGQQQDDAELDADESDAAAAEGDAGDQTGDEAATDGAADEEDSWVDDRSEEEIVARAGEIRARQSERRPAPFFPVESGFPWEYPLIAFAAIALALSAALAVRLLARP